MEEGMDHAAFSDGIAALVPEVRARRAEIEAARRLPADHAEALRRTDVLTHKVPPG